LKDSGAELLLGDFSDNGNEQVPMGGNISSSRLQERQDFYLHGGGTMINIKRKNALKIRSCTLGFAVKRLKGNGAFNQGYLTAGACIISRISRTSGIAFVLDINGNEVIVGTQTGTLGSYDPERGLDYAALKIRPNY